MFVGILLSDPVFPSIMENSILLVFVLSRYLLTESYPKWDGTLRVTYTNHIYYKKKKDVQVYIRDYNL